MKLVLILFSKIWESLLNICRDSHYFGAKEQIKALYGRDGRIFRQLVSVEDAFFSRGRYKYWKNLWGVMNSGLYKSTTTLVQASAAGLQATKSSGALLSHELPEEEILNGWWTQVIYVIRTRTR